MKNAKKIIVALLSVMMVLSLVACGNDKQEETTGGTDAQEVVKIAVAAPMTGDNSEYGIGFYNAVTMMADQWNENGGINGMKIQVLQYDDKNSPEEGVSVANKIASEKDIHGVIGHFASGVCMAAAPIYQDNNIIEISPSSSHPDYSGIGDLIFRNNTVIDKEARASLDIAVNDLGRKNIGIISIKTDWGVSTAKIVKDLIGDMSDTGAKVVAHEEVIEGSDDYRPAITKLNEAGADVVICVGMYNLVAPVAKQYREINPDIDIVGFSNSYSHQLIELGGEAVEGVAFPVIFFSESNDENIQKFVNDFKDRFGAEPSALTAQAYDSAGIFFEAVKEAGLDVQKIREAISNMTYEGVTGTTKFDEIGDVHKEFTKVVIKDGKFTKLGE